MVPKQYFKKLVNTDDIWEVRVKFGGEAYRLLGFFDGSNLVVLDYAFQKKTQKTNQSDINIAKTVSCLNFLVTESYENKYLFISICYFFHMA